MIKMTLWSGNAILTTSLLHFSLWGKFNDRHWALFTGNSPVTAEFPSQRPVTRSFGVFFDVRLNNRLSKQSRRRWYVGPFCSFWRHCNMAIGQNRGTVIISRINTAGSFTHDHNTLSALSSNSPAGIASVNFQCTFGGHFEIIFFHLMIWFKMTNEITLSGSILSIIIWLMMIKKLPTPNAFVKNIQWQRWQNYWIWLHMNLSYNEFWSRTWGWGVGWRVVVVGSV